MSTPAYAFPDRGLLVRRASPDSVLNWQQDAYGNTVPRLQFRRRLIRLAFTVGLTADLAPIDPVDVYIDENAQTYPFTYSTAQQEELTPYQNPADGTGRRVHAWIDLLNIQSSTPTIDFLAA